MHKIIYPVLALIEPKPASPTSKENLQTRIASAAQGFHIVITSQPRLDSH